MDGLPPGWLRDFRALVAAEPALHGEYLKAAGAVEVALADAIARAPAPSRASWNPRCWPRWSSARSGPPSYWARQASPSSTLVDVIRTAINMAVRGMAVRGMAVRGHGRPAT